MNQGSALHPAPAGIGPVPSEEFREALLVLRNAPTVHATCLSCGFHVVKWELNWQRGAIQPAAKPNAATTPGWEANPWLDKANHGKGRVTTSGTASDGLGTQNYTCRCGRNIPVSAASRMRLYLQAISRGERRSIVV